MTGLPSLTPDEQNVLAVFRDYLMTPGEMLCFAGPDLEKFKDSLVRLTDRGLLNHERFGGGYSLTKTGFAAMNRAPGSSA